MDPVITTEARLGQHLLDAGPAHQEGTAKIDRVRFLPRGQLLLVDRFIRRVKLGPGVRYHDVQAAERLDRSPPRLGRIRSFDTSRRSRGAPLGGRGFPGRSVPRLPPCVPSRRPRRPHRAINRAEAAPIPLPAPVIKATLFVNRMLPPGEAIAPPITGHRRVTVS